MQVILFDSSCILCSKTTQAVAQADKTGKLHFSPLGGNFAKTHIPKMEVQPETIIFYDNGKIFTKSEAIFEILKHLPKYRFLSFLNVIPLRFRNKIYDLVAKSRYKWFGKNASCSIDAQKLSDRLIA